MGAATHNTIVTAANGGILMRRNALSKENAEKDGDFDIPYAFPDSTLRLP